MKQQSILHSSFIILHSPQGETAQGVPEYCLILAAAMATVILTVLLLGGESSSWAALFSR